MPYPSGMTSVFTLLHRAGVPAPYLLAGHSFGGLYVLAFADRYPDEVAGMVLVDSTAHKPLVVLTAAVGSNAAWSTAQQRLAKLSSNTAHVVMSARTAQPLAR